MDTTPAKRQPGPKVGPGPEWIGSEDTFQHVDDSSHAREVSSQDVNDYLRSATNADYTAKDFRTWAGTLLAYRALLALEPAATEREAKS